MRKQRYSGMTQASLTNELRHSINPKTHVHKGKMVADRKVDTKKLLKSRITLPTIGGPK